EPKNELAVILVERRACDEAQTLLAAVLDDVFYPTRHFAEHNLARAEACSGNVEAAVERLTSLTSKRPKFCLAYLTASEVASRAQLHEETVEACESFRENCERDAEIGTKIPDALKATCDLRKGRAYMALGDVESARTAFERCRSAEKTRAACHDALELLPP
ncbi:MAG: tetratricopeptide repeat protein, partial [Myxococcota bacterium]